MIKHTIKYDNKGTRSRKPLFNKKELELAEAVLAQKKLKIISTIELITSILWQAFLGFCVGYTIIDMLGGIH